MKINDLVIYNPLDQGIPVKSEHIERRINLILLEAKAQQNGKLVLNAAQALVGAQKLSGKGLAQLYYGMKQDWEHYQIEDNLYDVIFEMVGHVKETVNRYINTWAMFEEKLIPATVEAKIKDRPIRDQVIISALPAQGYEVTNKQWKAISNAPDNSTLQKIVRKIKGKEPRKSALILTLDREGNIWATQKHVREYAGHLEIINNSEMIKKATQRIIKNSGIMED